MRLAISNIAWSPAEDDIVASLLQRFAIDAIDIAPGKYFSDPFKATDKDIVRCKAWWAERGIEVTGMQALLFGTTGLNVFGAPACQAALLDHLAAICRIGGVLGATRMVFGSPKNRDRSGLTDENAQDMAVDFFGRLGDIAYKCGVTICLEPNPVCYGANFMTTSAETARIVTAVAHPAIRMQLDTGALLINHEDPLVVVRDFSTLIGHIHASEPLLSPLGEGGTGHKHELMAAAIAQYLPKHLVTIEMVATDNEPHLVSIERALRVAKQYYSTSGVEV